MVINESMGSDSIDWCGLGVRIENIYDNREAIAASIAESLNDYPHRLQHRYRCQR